MALCCCISYRRQIGEIYVDGINRSTAQNCLSRHGHNGIQIIDYILDVEEVSALYHLVVLYPLLDFQYQHHHQNKSRRCMRTRSISSKRMPNATLYGSSDAVTALAYDEDTELLHVGTSSGRSDFQGLRRINNTTTAVTTAISASDELIAEQ